MSDTSKIISDGYAHAQKAIHHDKAACKGNNPEDFNAAKNSYMRAIEHYMTALKWEKNDRVKSSLRDKINSYVERAEIMKEWLKKLEEQQKAEAEAKLNENNGTGTGGGGDNSMEAKGKKKDGKDDETEKMRSQLGSAILTEKPNVKWEDVAGLEGAKEALKEAVILPQKFPQMFVGKRKPWKGILLYGPPGTGKSFLAKAVATESDAQFFSVSSSDLVSKWQGESEKLVKELFAMARKAGKAIIFIDEIDALVSTRSDNESESSRRIKTEFLVQMDGVGKSTDGVLLLGATNIPWGLDDALLRRMERRVYIPLPDAYARARMFRIHLGSTPNNLTDENYNELGQRTAGYSGSDIAIVVRDAIMQPVRTLQQATLFKPVKVKQESGSIVTKLTPCSPGDPEGQEMSLMDVKGDELEVPPVSVDDFIVALESTKPSVSVENIQQHEKFTSEKGQSGV